MKRLWLIFVLLLLSVCAQAQQPIAGNGTVNTAQASWTSGTSVPTCSVVVSGTSIYNAVVIDIIAPTTLTGGVLTFKESLDNTNWTSIQGVQLGPTTIVGPTYTLVAGTANVGVMILFPMGAAPYFEVCLTTAIVGSGTTTIQSGLQTLPQAALLAGTTILAAGSNTIGAVTGSGVFEVGPTTGANTSTNPFFYEVTDGTNVMGAMANFGTTPGAVKAQHVNASLFIGTTIVSSSNPFPISATGAANSKTNPIFTGASDGTNTVTASIAPLGTAPTGTEVETVNNVPLPTTASGTALTGKAVTTLTSGTAGVSVKTSAGNVYGFSLLSGSTAGCWIEFINSTGAGTLGTAVIFSVAMPTSGVVNQLPADFPLGAFSSGIAVGAVTTNGGATACATATSITLFYK